MKSIHAKRAFMAVALAVTAMTGVPSLANATAAEPAEQQVVRYADLNLATQAGVEALFYRIRSAAENVCGPSIPVGSRVVSRDWEFCASNALRRAVLTVNDVGLTAYYARRVRSPSLLTVG